MTTRGNSHGRHAHPASDPSATEPSEPQQRRVSPQRKRRRATLYDAVAGRVTTSGPLNTISLEDGSQIGAQLHRTHESYSYRSAVLSPEEVLFKRAGVALEKQEEVYFANERNLPDGGRDVLPDSDLVKSIHVYSSRFYEAIGRRNPSRSSIGSRLVNERSMDETALLAFGILLEEAARELIKKGGDLVFTEGMAELNGKEVFVGVMEGEDFHRRTYPKPKKRQKTQRRDDSEDQEASEEVDSTD